MLSVFEVVQGCLTFQLKAIFKQLLCKKNKKSD